MKGYADYVILGYDKVHRELAREALGIKEVPLEADAFKQWLIEEGLGERTANSYLSYIRRMNDELFPDIMENEGEVSEFFYWLKECLEKAPEETMELMGRMQSAIKQEQKKGTSEFPQKTLNNWHSAFVRYMEFIGLLIEADGEEENEKEVKKEETAVAKKAESIKIPSFGNKNVSYDEKTLRRIFRSRLVTQDRLTGEEGKVYYPIRLVKKIFNTDAKAKKFINRWFDGLIDNIEVLTDQREKPFKLKEISEVNINPKGGHVAVSMGEGQEALTLLTHTAAGETTSMDVKTLRDISIDHKIPIHAILVDKADQLKGLAILTANIKNYKGKKRKMGASKLSTEVFNKMVAEGLISDELIKCLTDDLTLIKKSTTLELMDRKQNISKQAK